MKRLIALFLVVAFIFSLSACTDGNSENASATADQSDPTQETSDENTESVPDSESEPDDDHKEEKMLNILFLGNSLMYYNDMPELFEKMAKTMGKKVNVRSVTKGSATISDFANEKTDVGAEATQLLENNPWDIVIIEPSRRISPYENTVKEAELASAKMIQALAKNAGGDVLLYSVWGNNNGSVGEYKADSSSLSYSSVASHVMARKPHTAFLHQVNLEFAEALGGVKLAPAGYAFENCMSKYDYDLYHSDERHPSPIGSYLAAAVIYVTIFEEEIENIPWNIQNAPASGNIEEIANKTVLESLEPDLAESGDGDGGDGGDGSKDTFNLLIVGTNLMDNYSCARVFSDLLKEVENREVLSTYVRSSTFVINDLVNEKSDLGLRNVLDDVEWDAIVIQISRRCTRSAADVEESELNALRTVMPLFKAETDKIFLFTLNSKAAPGIFTTANGDPGYSDTGRKESYSATEGSAYFKSLADKWANELGIGVINYGQAYHAYSNPEKAGLGYLQACMIYQAVFGKPLPDGTKETNGLSDAAAKQLRELAESYYCG